MKKVFLGIIPIAVILIIILYININLPLFQYTYSPFSKETQTRSVLTSQEITAKSEISAAKEVYLEVGYKHVPIAAIDSFNKHGISLELTSEEKEAVTSLEDFFLMGFDVPKDVERFAISPNEYEILIVGDVENPVSLKYEELLEKFEIKQIVTELYCMPSLTGVGKFVGPSLYDIISYAKPKDDTAKLIFIAGDGYEKGWRGEFPLKKIEENEETYLLAIAMNGYPLSIEHGYPARLALESEQGSRWVKWIVKIIVVPANATSDDYSNLGYTVSE